MNVNLFLLRSEVPPMVMWDPMGCPWTSEVPVPCSVPWHMWDAYGPVIARCLSQCPMVHVGSHGPVIARCLSQCPMAHVGFHGMPMDQ